jgi:hypothetical protein
MGVGDEHPPEAGHTRPAPPGMVHEGGDQVAPVHVPFAARPFDDAQQPFVRDRAPHVEDGPPGLRGRDRVDHDRVRLGQIPAGAHAHARTPEVVRPRGHELRSPASEPRDGVQHGGAVVGSQHGRPVKPRGEDWREVARLPAQGGTDRVVDAAVDSLPAAGAHAVAGVGVGTAGGSDVVEGDQPVLPEQDRQQVVVERGHGLLRAVDRAGGEAGADRSGSLLSRDHNSRMCVVVVVGVHGCDTCSGVGATGLTGRSSRRIA